MYYPEHPEHEYSIHECVKCYYSWEEPYDKGRAPENPIYCDYCFDHLNMTHLELIKRRLDILKFTLISRSPEIMSDMFNYLLERLDKIEKNNNVKNE